MLLNSNFSIEQHYWRSKVPNCLKTTCLFFIITCLPSSALFGETVKHDDVSRLNAVTVSKIVKVYSQDDVVSTLKTLPANTKVSISGTRHSQGGHLNAQNAVVLDMTNFKQVVSFSPQSKTIIVQSGATWADVQLIVNQHGLAVKVMQSSNIFSIGGSLSANVHGRDPRYGPLIETIKSIKIALANGDVVSASRTINPKLFYASIGGYGLLGVILEAEIQLTDNTELIKSTYEVSVDKYAQDIAGKAENLSLHFGRCSFVQNESFLSECYSTNYQNITTTNVVSKLEPEKNVKRNAFIFSRSRQSNLGKKIRWRLQKSIVDKPGKTKKTERNIAMQPPVKFLEYDNPSNTDILQEYFVPIDNFEAFFAAFKKELIASEVNLLSTTLRYLKPNTESYLSYATDEMIAIVIYVNIELNESALNDARTWTRSLVDLALKHDGTYYLTYQRFPSLEQFRAAYPNWQKFLEIKLEYDPKEIFSSQFYEYYLQAQN